MYWSVQPIYNWSGRAIIAMGIAANSTSFAVQVAKPFDIVSLKSGLTLMEFPSPRLLDLKY
jgi:hypothetical protein